MNEERFGSLARLYGAEALLKIQQASICVVGIGGVGSWVIEALARFMRWTVGTSGAETLSCTANIFVGQTEAPLLIRAGGNRGGPLPVARSPPAGAAAACGRRDLCAF